MSECFVLLKRGKMRSLFIMTMACSTDERYLSTPLAAEARTAVGG
jgi:hypothetical protein